MVRLGLYHPGCFVTAVASWAESLLVGGGCIHEQNVYSFSKITSYKNSSLLFLKHLAIAYPDKETPTE
jgi:hypothetical protein